MKKCRKEFIIAAGFLAAFVLWTIAVKYVDVQAIGPYGSVVGFAHFNNLVHNITGVHWPLYTATDWLGLVPIAVCFGFGVLGLAQWIRRKRISQVDKSILILGGYYIVVMAVYILFEYVVINRRPVLIDGFLEGSYPSSTTMLVLCVMPTAMLQLRKRINNKAAKCIVLSIFAIFTVLMVIGRLVSGVHWVSDIIGGVLVSAGLVTMYMAVCKVK